MLHIRAQICRATMRIHLQNAIQPTHLLTFNFGYQVKSQNASKPVTTFFNALQRLAFGRDWAIQQLRPWPIAYGFFERAGLNPHYHVLARLDLILGVVAWSNGENLWQRWAPRGQFDIQVIDNLPRAISYCTKRYLGDQAHADMFIYSDTRE